MSTSAMTYAIDAMAASGFVVLDAVVAMELRPDLWRDGAIARAELASDRFQVALRALNHTSRSLVKLDGVEGDVPVQTRSMRELAARIEFVTGRSCELLPAGGTPVRKSAWAGVRDRESPGPAPVGDLYRDVPLPAKAIPVKPRPCTDCKRLQGDQCGAPSESGIRYPAKDVARRCPAFLMPYGAIKSTGLELWPELQGLPLRRAGQAET